MKKYLQSLQERKADENDEGFTLIELLIVIVVLGILAAVVVFALGSVTGNAKSSACQADAKQIVTAVQTFNAQNAPTVIAFETTGPPAGTTQQALLVSGGYLSAWPSTNNGYSLRLANAGDTGAVAGDVMVTVGAATVNYKNEVPVSGTVAGTGCFAL